MIALHAIDRPAHRIDHQTPRHRLALDARMQFRRGIERPFAGAVADQLERPKEAAPRMSPTNGCCPKRSLRRRSSLAPISDHIGEQPVPPDDILHRQRRRCGHRVAHIGMAVLKGA